MMEATDITLVRRLIREALAPIDYDAIRKAMDADPKLKRLPNTRGTKHA